MPLQELLSLVSPPAKPIDAGPLPMRSSIEAKLGLVLPNDYVELGATYGTGSFAQMQFMVINPFASWYERRIEEVSVMFGRIRREQGAEQIPFELFPESPGLLIWGEEAHGHSMFWLTQGDPDSWPILLYNRDYGEFERWDATVTEFLVGIFTQQIRCVLWSEESQRTLRPEFEPYTK